MAVEILILSGARRNERIALDCRAFQAGCDPDCEVYFHPERDSAVKGRSAKFRLQEGGWYVRCTGGEMWIGKQRIVGATHVRSGDVIRMSESGPEFSFHVVAAAKASDAKAAGRDGVSRNCTDSCGNGAVAAPTSGKGDSPIFADTKIGTVPLSNIASALPEANGLSVAMAAPLPTDHQTVAEEAPAAKERDRQWLIWVVGALAAGILALLAVRALFFSPTINVTVNQPAASASPTASTNDPTSAKTSHEKSREKKTDDASGDNERAHIAGGDESKEPAAPRAAKDLGAQLKEAVFLIVVEKAGHSWPHATCVAVGNDTLLTSAVYATDLAEMRDKDSFKIWVTRPGDNLKFTFKAEVRDIRVLAPFAVASEKSASTDRLFLDIGLLTVQGPLPKIASLASSKELDAVDEGFPVACFGFTHKGQKMTRYDSFEPRLTEGSVYGIEAARRNLPGEPKLLHVQAEIPQNAYGSPVVNGEGKILGIYSDAVPEEKSQGLKNLHYVTIVNPDLIDLWLRDRGSASIWVPASPVPTAPTTPKQP
jgi:hypothetical protein